jgi:Major Facilitator Superfamily
VEQLGLDTRKRNPLAAIAADSMSRAIARDCDRRRMMAGSPISEFAACCIIIFSAYAVLYGGSTSLPGLLQSLFGYNALAAGLVMSPAGFFAVPAMPIVSRLLGRQTDARWLIGAGLLLIAISNYWMSQMNLDISPDQVTIWPRAGLVVGLVIVFAPVNVAAYLYTPPLLRGVGPRSRRNCRGLVPK